MDKTGGIKHDGEKIQLELLSTIWLLGVGQVLTSGARKYAAHNWRLGIARSRLLGACLRHVLAYMGGEDNDPETGLSHLYHASCCLMFASELHVTRPDTDDRYKAPTKPTATELLKQGTLPEPGEDGLYRCLRCRMKATSLMAFIEHIQQDHT